MVRKNNPVAWICSKYILQFFNGDKLTRLQPRKQLIAILLKRIAIFFFFVCFAPCKGIQHSLRFWIPQRGFHRDSRYSGFQSFSVDLVFWIPISSGIQDSFSCMYSEFHKQNFPDSGISDCLTFDDLLNMFPRFLADIRQSQNVTKQFQKIV